MKIKTHRISGFLGLPRNPEIRDKGAARTATTLITAAALITAAGLMSVMAAEGPAAPSSKPRIALVIDDFGLTYPKNVPDEEWMKLAFPLTFAVMPESPRTTKAAQAAKASGKEVLVHFPFDPFLSLSLPAREASSEDVRKVMDLLEKSFRTIPGASGLNNHRSYKATQNAPLMRAFMKEFKKKGLFFVDSGVSPKSVAYLEAASAGIRTARNDLFLDEARRHDKAFCRRMLRRAADIARKKGHAVAIGHHYFHGTFEGITEMAPELQKEGFEFVFASQVVR